MHGMDRSIEPGDLVGKVAMRTDAAAAAVSVPRSTGATARRRDGDACGGLGCSPGGATAAGGGFGGGAVWGSVGLGGGCGAASRRRSAGRPRRDLSHHRGDGGLMHFLLLSSPILSWQCTLACVYSSTLYYTH